MAYRDDRQALLDRLAAAEREIQGAARLRERIRELEMDIDQLLKAPARQRIQELENENRVLKRKLDLSHQRAAPLISLPDDIYVDPKIHEFIDSIVAATRAAPHVVSGARAAVAGKVVEAAQAEATSHDRKFVVPGDVSAVVSEALAHSIILSTEAEAQGVTVEAVLDQVLAAVEVP